jgi:hypothetical protein
MNHVKYTILFLLISNLSIAQIKIEIQNKDIDDISAINVCLENSQVIKNTMTKSVGKTIFIEANGYNKIRLSHIGYYDTTLVIKDFTESHTILLRPKVIQLNEVVVKSLQSLTHIDKRKKKSQIMKFVLTENRIWYFEINLSHLEIKELYEVNIELSNIIQNN